MKMATRLNRRTFLRTTAAASFAGAMLPQIVPAAVLGKDGGVAPSNRIVVGCIGLGPQGTGDMRGFLAQKDAQVVAVCDVKQDRLEQARDLVNSTYQTQACATYTDFHQVLARKDIQACLVATPDHWHVPISLAAVKAGKDVYMEKPFGCSLAENQALRDAVHKYKRIFQFGTQQRSSKQFRLACELVRNKAIGDLQHIAVWAPGSSPGGSTQPVAVPPTLDYDKWLGPAPQKPYTEDRCAAEGNKKTWWYISDYSFGFITGWGIHPMDIGLWGGWLLTDGTVEIEGTAHYPTAAEGSTDTATTWDINCTFGTGVTLKFIGVPNPQLAGSKSDEAWPHQDELKRRYGQIKSHGTAFEGSKGWVCVDRGRLATSPETLAETKEDALTLKLKASTNHVRDFLDSIVSREPAVANVDEAFRADALCQVCDIAARLKRKVTFDFKKEKFVKDDEANKRLQLRQMRKPFGLG